MQAKNHLKNTSFVVKEFKSDVNRVKRERWGKVLLTGKLSQENIVQNSQLLLGLDSSSSNSPLHSTDRKWTWWILFTSSYIVVQGSHNWSSQIVRSCRSVPFEVFLLKI